MSVIKKKKRKKEKTRKFVFHPLEVLESSLILDYCRNLAGKRSLN